MIFWVSECPLWEGPARRLACSSSLLGIRLGVMIGSLRDVDPSPAFPLLPAATRSDGLEVSSTSEAVSVG
jgi:hypothetical protein